MGLRYRALAARLPGSGLLRSDGSAGDGLSGKPLDYLLQYALAYANESVPLTHTYVSNVVLSDIGSFQGASQFGGLDSIVSSHVDKNFVNGAFPIFFQLASLRLSATDRTTSTSLRGGAF